jgi:hypothetical protein
VEEKNRLNNGKFNSAEEEKKNRDNLSYSHCCNQKWKVVHGEILQNNRNTKIRMKKK